MLESASKLQSIKQKQKAPFTDERLLQVQPVRHLSCAAQLTSKNK